MDKCAREAGKTPTAGHLAQLLSIQHSLDTDTKHPLAIRFTIRTSDVTHECEVQVSATELQRFKSFQAAVAQRYGLFVRYSMDENTPSRFRRDCERAWFDNVQRAWGAAR